MKRLSIVFLLCVACFGRCLVEQRELKRALVVPKGFGFGDVTLPVFLSYRGEVAKFLRFAAHERRRRIAEIRARDIQDPAYYWNMSGYTAPRAADIWNALDAYTICHDTPLWPRQ